MTLLTTSPAQVVGQGFMTFLWAAGTTLRRTTEQVWLPYHPLHITNPSHIIRNQAPHAPRTALTPSAPTHARCSCDACAGCGLILWRRLEEQHGPRTSSNFVRPWAKPWAGLEGPPPQFSAGAEPIYRSRDRFLRSQARRTGPLGGVADGADRFTDDSVGS